ncbi:hypothetical protein Hanom_Chr05g00431581 [Helianthus anomalus]
MSDSSSNEHSNLHYKVIHSNFFNLNLIYVLIENVNKENYVAAFGDDIASSVFLLDLKEKFMWYEFLRLCCFF